MSIAPGYPSLAIRCRRYRTLGHANARALDRSCFSRSTALTVNSQSERRRRALMGTIGGMRSSASQPASSLQLWLKAVSGRRYKIGQSRPLGNRPDVAPN